MDRISELPTEILHQILSLLSTKTAARTAVLSKLWLKTSNTNPRLIFDESDFYSTSDESDVESDIEYVFESDSDTSDEYYVEDDFEVDLEGKHNSNLVDTHGEFSNIVDNILERYHRENLPISDFKLRICFSDQTDCDGLVDKWLGILAEQRVSQLALLVKSRSGIFSKRYSLLADTIFSIESLQELELRNCKILKRRMLLSEDKIKCRSLKSLTLYYITVSESALDSLISCCPHILTISLQYCIGFSRIRVPKSLPNLLSLDIVCCPVEEVHIVDAPKMLSFGYESNWEEIYSSDKICLRVLNIGTCQNLSRVEFVEAGIDDAFLSELIPKLHFIKDLILHFCEYLNEINISSSTLEVCSIVKCDLLFEAIFDAPKLLSLAFSNQHRLPSLSFVSASSQCRISIKYDTIMDAEQLMHLRRSLVELHDQVVDLALPTINKDLRLASVIDHLPPPEVDSLLSYCPNSTYSSYFDLIFSICWPKSLIIQYCDHDFGEFLRQQLLKERQWRFFECTWKEYLMNAQIEYKRRTRNDWMTLDRKMLAANPRIIEEINTMCFKQIQRKEKNKYSYISRWIPSWIA